MKTVITKIANKSKVIVIAAAALFLSLRIIPIPFIPDVKAKQCDTDQIMLVLDKSDSMVGDELDPYPTREAALKDISKNFVNTINFSEDKVGVVLFSDKYTLAAKMGSSKSSILSVISSYTSDHGTMIDGALSMALQNMPAAINGGDRYIVLITDGQQDDDSGTISVANQIKSKGITLAALAMGDKTDNAMLKSIASGGYYYSAENSKDLNKFYDLISTDVKCNGAVATQTPTPTATPKPPKIAPEFDSFKFSCDPDVNSPYVFTAKIDIYGAVGTTISKAYAVLAPTSTLTGLYTYSGGTVTGPMAQSVNVPSYTSISSPNYTIPQKSFPTGKRVITYAFNVDFQNATPFFQSILSGLDVYLYIEDSTGTTNSPAGKLEKVMTKYTPESYTSCGHLYFTTSNGDFRSNEPGAYSGKLGTKVIYNVQGNKFWQTQNNTNSEYAAVYNSNDTVDFPKSSNYTFEAESDVVPRSTTNVNHNFDVELPGTPVGIHLERDILKNLADSLTVAYASFKTLQKYEITSTNTDYPGKVDRDQAKKELAFDISDIKTDKTLIIIDDNDYENVVVNDKNGNSGSKLIIWCKTFSCNLKIASPYQVDDLKIDAAGSVKYISFNNAGAKPALITKSRIYLNYNPSDSIASTPIDAGFDYGSFKIPSTRTVELLDSTRGNGKNNYYIGAILTNGFLVTSHSSTTDVIKGLVHARGIIVNATDKGTDSVYFKDFPNPFLHIDFDPKYHSEFMRILYRFDDFTGTQFIGL